MRVYNYSEPRESVSLKTHHTQREMFDFLTHNSRRIGTHLAPCHSRFLQFGHGRAGDPRLPRRKMGMVK